MSLGALACYLQDRLTQQKQSVALAHAQQPEKIYRMRLLALYALALFFLLVGVFSFFVQGYHAWFIPLNALSKNIPEFVLQNLTVFGDGGFLLALILLCTPKQPRFHWTVFLTALIGGIVSATLKDAFDALRPPAVLAAESFNLFGKAYYHHSFPSGHTLTAFLMATLVFYVAPHVWQRVGIIIAAVLVGLSRVWLGVHWPLDALAGAVLGILCGSAGIVLAHQWASGLTPVMHRIILALLLISALLITFTANDYSQAQPLLCITGIAAIWRTIRVYMLPAEKNIEYINENSVKIPFFKHRLSSVQVFWGTLLLLVTYRFLVLLQPHFSLFYDEAYYYHWSLNPDLGYYSKPPMVGWCIWLSTTLLGNSVFAIKSMANILYAGSAIAIFATVRRYSSATSALIGGLIFISVPMIGFNSEFITTDAPLIFFWSLALFFTLKAIETSRATDWLLLGVCTGLGMLSKYTMGALPLAVFGYLLTSNTHRPLLFSIGPWIAAITAGLIFGLNIYWNYMNEWVALRHTQEISKTSGSLFHLDSLVEFVVAQFFIFGAISSGLLIKSIKSYRATKTVSGSALSKQHFHLLMWIMLTILVAISIQAFLARAFPNWAGPWVVSASVLLAMSWRYAFSPTRFYRWLGYSLTCNLLLLSIFYHWPTLLDWMKVEPTRKNDPFHRVRGWPELGQELRPFLNQHPDAILTSDSRDLLAYLGYYGAPGSFNFARWNPNEKDIRDYYDLKVNLRLWQGNTTQSFIFVTKKPLDERMIDRFIQVKALGTISTQVYHNQTMTVYISHATGFRGYGDQ